LLFLPYLILSRKNRSQSANGLLRSRIVAPQNMLVNKSVQPQLQRPIDATPAGAGGAAPFADLASTASAFEIFPKTGRAASGSAAAVSALG
jgi:hypothetical protein